MRPIAKSFLVAATVLVASVVVLTLGMNVWLHAPGTREKLLKGLSSAVGSPVTVRGVLGLPLGVIRIQGLDLQREGTKDSLSVESLTLVPDYRALLHGRVGFSELVVNHPVLHFRADQSSASPGAVTVPQQAPLPPSGIERETPMPPTVEVTTRDQPPSSSTLFQDTVFQIAKPGFKLGLNRLSINRGELVLLDQSGHSLIGIEGLTLETTSSPETPWKGIVEARSLLLGSSFGEGGGIRIHDLKAPISLQENLSSLTLEPLLARFGAGHLEGTVHWELPPASPRYRALFRLTGASLRDLLTDTSYGPSSAEGKVGGEIRLGGVAGDPSSMEGDGSVLCTETTIQPVDFLKQIGQLLQVDELQLLRLSEAKSIFHLRGGQLYLDDLLLRSQNILLAAKGPLHPSGDLDLEARLLFNEKMTGRLRGLLGPQLTAAPEPGYSQVVFHVSGSPSHPKTDLLERLTGLRIGGDLGGFLQGLFGRPSPPRAATPPPPATNR